MSHQTLKPCHHDLEKYLAGELGPEDEVAVARHVESCDYCQGGLNALLASAERDPWLRRLHSISAADVADVSFLEQIIRDQPRSELSADMDSPRFVPHLKRCIATCIVSLVTIVVVIAVLFLGPSLSTGASSFLSLLLLAGVLLLFMALVALVSPVLELVVMQRVLKIKQAETADAFNDLKKVMQDNVDSNQEQIVIPVDERMKDVLSN